MDRLKADQPIMHEPEADDSPPADSETLEAPPRAFLPTTPFGDAKPFAGSFIDPTDPRNDPDEAAELAGTPPPGEPVGESADVDG